jgi:hypothetical protein
MTTLVTLAVDPGATSGLCLWVGDRMAMLKSVKCGAEPFSIMRLAIGLAVDMVPNPGQAAMAMVTESQFLPVPDDETAQRGRPDLARWQSVASVVRSAARWEGVASCFGFSVLDQWAPQSWQAAVPKVEGERKAESARAWVRARLFLDRLPSEDEAAAAVIACLTHTERLAAHHQPIPALLGWAAAHLARKRPKGPTVRRVAR